MPQKLCRTLLIDQAFVVIEVGTLPLVAFRRVFVSSLSFLMLKITHQQVVIGIEGSAFILNYHFLVIY